MRCGLHPYSRISARVKTVSDGSSVKNQLGRSLSLSSLICGSEGTLALIAAIMCRVEIPAMTAVVVVRYGSLNDGLLAVPSLLEFIDDKILAMAEQTEFWVKASPVLAGEMSGVPARSMHFAEFVGKTEEPLQAQVNKFDCRLKSRRVRN